MWVLNDKEILTKNNIQFYIYLDELRVEAINILHLTEEAVTEVSKNCKVVDRALGHLHSSMCISTEVVADDTV